MSLVHDLHKAHRQRLARIAAAVYVPPKPVAAEVFASAHERKIQDWVDRCKLAFADEAAWQLEIVGTEAQLHHSLPSTPAVPIRHIQTVVCEHFGITRVDLVSIRRTKNVVMPRHIAIYLCRHFTERSLPEISRQFGDRDHTTALSAYRKITQMMETDEAVRTVVFTLAAKIST